jgi:flagellin-like protein
MWGSNDPTGTAERGISPVVGVILMVGIVVLLAAVVAAMVVDFGSQLREPVPAGGFEHEYVSSGAGNTDDRPYVNITHSVGRTVDGDDIVISDGSGNSVAWTAVWTGGSEVRAGEFVHIDGFGSDGALDPICEEGQTYRVVIERDDGTTAVVEEWTVPGPPALPAGSASDSDGDGIPDWC